MASPMRLDPTLIAAAVKEGLMNKRTPPKQIEYWAELGKAVERVLNYDDVIAILEGFKKIVVEPVTSIAVDPDNVFNALEKSRKRGELSDKVTTSAVYYEASVKYPGLLDKVDSTTGKRQTGRFVNGEFRAQG
jgi:hypothetical protein